MKKHCILFTIIMLFLCNFSLLFFVYEQNRINDQSIYMKIPSQGLSLDIESTSEERLVPKGYAVFVGQTENIFYTYRIDLTEYNHLERNLLVKTENIRIGNSLTHANLINIYINENLYTHVRRIDANILEIIVKVTLTEPASRVVFEEIVGKSVTFGLTFEIV